MKIETSGFGKTPDGREVVLYTISNSRGMRAFVSNVGAALVRLMVPDRDGHAEDLVLGFDRAEDYFRNKSFFGVVVGPSANRIGGASFAIDGATYSIAVNDGPNNLHSDMERGYHKCFWEAEILEDGVRFSLEDPDGSMGFPGNKRVSVAYTLDEDNRLTLRYHGASDADTILNPTNHTYFNLDGHKSGNIEGHTLRLAASHYTPTVKGSIPTGEIAAVAGTPMDFTQSKRVGQDIEASFEQLVMAKGYDHNWVVDDWDGSLRQIATVRAERSGRVMNVYTTLPGVQFYAGNCIEPETGKGGAQYGKRSGLCLETQYFPDSIHHDNFPSCVFGGDREYDSVTVYAFEN